MTSKYRNYINNTSQRKYSVVEQIGSGAYGVVYKGIREDDKSYIALKRIFVRALDNGLPLSTLRELSALAQISEKSDTIVTLLDTIPNKVDDKYCIDIIFELLPSDLEQYLKKFDNTYVPMSKTISISMQLLDAVYFMHVNRIIHRDLKPANILIDSKTTKIKITDFGLARTLGYDASLTPEVVTLWYRPPEILLSGEYSYSCDVWSAGCIIGELIYGRPIFLGDNQVQQLTKIITRLGPCVIPYLQNYNMELNPLLITERDINYCLQRADTKFADLVKKMLHFNPHERITSDVAYENLKQIESNFIHNNSVASNSNSSLDNVTLPSGSSSNSTNGNGQPSLLPNQHFNAVQQIPVADSHYCISTEIVNSVVRNVLDEDEEEVSPNGDENDDKSDLSSIEAQSTHSDESLIHHDEEEEEAENEIPDVIGLSEENDDDDDEAGVEEIENEESDNELNSFDISNESNDSNMVRASIDNFTNYRRPTVTTSEDDDATDDSGDTEDDDPQPVTNIEQTYDIHPLHEEDEEDYQNEVSVIRSPRTSSLKRTNSKPLEEQNCDNSSSNKTDNQQKSPYLNKARKRDLDSSNEADYFEETTKSLNKPTPRSFSNLRRRISELPLKQNVVNNSKSQILRSESVQQIRRQYSRQHTFKNNEIVTTNSLANCSFGENSLRRHLPDNSPNNNNDNDNNNVITNRPLVLARRRSTMSKHT